MRIALTLLALALATPQEKPGVDALLAKIDGKDSQACFQAIADLVALDASQRNAIEAGAAKLPAFYKDALLSELKARESLKDLFGKEIKVTLKGEKTVLAHLEDLEKQSGTKFEPGWQLRRTPGDPFGLDLADVSPMSALMAICDKAKQIPNFYYASASLIELQQRSLTGKPYLYRNFAVLPGNFSSQRVTDFSGAPRWTGTLQCGIVWDSAVKVMDWNPKVRLIEAVTDKGEVLEPAGEAPPSALSHDEEAPNGGRATNSWFSFTFKMNAGVEKIARLRMAVTGRIPLSVSELSLTTFSPLDKAKVFDDSFEITVTDVSAPDSWNPETTVVVKSKKMKPEEILAQPVTFTLKYKNQGDGRTWSTIKKRDDGVEYKIRWWAVDGNMHGGEGPNNVLESLKVLIPLTTAERPLFVELTDIPLK